MASIIALTSGGLDSSVMAADLSKRFDVYPVYVRAGLVWETDEIEALNRFLSELKSVRIKPLTELSLPVRNLYPTNHWSITGKNIPDSDSQDEEMYIPGRNILLIGFVAVWASVQNISRIAIGSLAGNPFPDATPSFYESFGKALSQGLNHRIFIETPLRIYKKDEIIRKYSTLPLHLTLTCARPKAGLHCGVCNKCYERMHAFNMSGIADTTTYSQKSKNQ